MSAQRKVEQVGFGLIRFDNHDKGEPIILAADKIVSIGQYGPEGAVGLLTVSGVLYYVNGSLDEVAINVAAARGNDCAPLVEFYRDHPTQIIVDELRCAAINWTYEVGAIKDQVALIAEIESRPGEATEARRTLAGMVRRLHASIGKVAHHSAVEAGQ